MKKNEKKELRTKTVEELLHDVKNLKKEIVELSHEMKIGKSSASALLRSKKKDVARLLTIIGQMRLNPVTPKIEEKKTMKKIKTEDTEKKVIKKGEDK